MKKHCLILQFIFKLITFSSQSHIVYVGNLKTDQLENNDINSLIESYVKSGKNKTTNKDEEVIETVRVFKNSIYISCRSEVDAQNAASFFNGFKFKSFTLSSFYVDLNNLSVDDQNETEEEFSDYSAHTSSSKSNKIQFMKIECEIIVANRCLK